MNKIICPICETEFDQADASLIEEFETIEEEGMCLDCNFYFNKMKVGMYGEMPKIKIGRFTISMMTDKKEETKIWIQDGEDEGMEIDGKKMESMIETFFNENF